jgi:tRNA(adenine34) deaminase
LEAEKALEADEIPIGAVVVCNNKVIARAHNQTETLNDVTAHAEMLAITAAANALGAKYLDECTLYVTLEPCPMCGWAILQSRISKVYFGSYDVNYGAFSSRIDLRKLTSSKTEVYGGIEEIQCDKILNDFFCKIRKE